MIPKRLLAFSSGLQAPHRTRAAFSRSQLIPQRYSRHIYPLQLPAPPSSRASPLLRTGKAVPIKHGANVVRRSVRKRIAAKQPQDFRRTLQKSCHEANDPGIALVVAQGCEPHLPVQARLVRCDPRGSAGSLPVPSAYGGYPLRTFQGARVDLRVVGHLVLEEESAEFRTGWKPVGLPPCRRSPGSGSAACWD